MEHGDYATNAALAAMKTLKNPPAGGPREVANALKKEIEGKIDGVEKIEVAGAGFINFFVSKERVLEALSQAQTKGWGSNDLYAGKMVMVEYTSPNLFKQLHIGNLVGNILGESIARLFEASGAEVKRLNYPSDIGLTVAKGVWGLWKHHLNPENIEELGKAYVLGNAAYEDSSAKEEIEQINKALYEASNQEWSTLREKGIQTSRKHLDALCERLGTRFDKEIFESESGPHGREIVKAHIGKVFQESEGAVIFTGAHTRVFLNSQGLPTYEAKEVGLFDLKKTAFPHFDISITVTGSEQKDFFSVVFEAIRKVFPRDTEGKMLRHVANGFLRLTTGKMSSRKGNIITGESLIADLTEEARGREDVAIGGVKYTVLRSTAGKDIIFDPEKSLSLEGDSGPYLQYSLVRARSLLHKAEDAREVATRSGGDETPDLELGRIILHFPEVVYRAAGELEPHHLVTYLTELSSAFNSWYAAQRMIVDGEILGVHKNLVRAVENTLAKGLMVLGIPAPEQM
jgi:arginyl-tRNA synthetase